MTQVWWPLLSCLGGKSLSEAVPRPKPGNRGLHEGYSCLRHLLSTYGVKGKNLSPGLSRWVLFHQLLNICKVLTTTRDFLLLSHCPLATPLDVESLHFTYWFHSDACFYVHVCTYKVTLEKPVSEVGCH